MQILSVREVATRLGVAVRSVQRMAARGEFIEPIQVSPQRIGFVEGEFNAWLANRPRGKHQQPAHLATSDPD